MFLIFSWGWPSSPRDIWNGRWKLPGSFFQIAGKRCTWQQGWQLVQECIWEVWASNLGCILSGFSQKTSFSHDIFVFFFHHQLRAGNTRGTQCEGDPAKPVIWTLTFWVLFFLFFLREWEAGWFSANRTKRAISLLSFSNNLSLSLCAGMRENWESFTFFLLHSSAGKSCSQNERRSRKEMNSWAIIAERSYRKGENRKDWPCNFEKKHKRGGGQLQRQQILSVSQSTWRYQGAPAQGHWQLSVSSSCWQIHGNSML